MYKIIPSTIGGPTVYELHLDLEVVATFYDRATADLVCNLLNVTRMAPISARMQAG